MNFDATFLDDERPAAPQTQGARLDAVERAVARSGAPVLIRGETGSGKELQARRLHELSGRHGPFVAVNCGALSETLLDAELFGHEAGAFTGADRARAGWFETARGGTLFLDEVGELSPSAQVKLLRVLQERQVSRIGSRRAIALDVRVISATHVDLMEAVEAQRFRIDLYYRLNVAPMRVPPLRERKDEILPLAHYFVRLHAERMRLPGRTLGAEAAERLLAHPWPGNVRELENAIQAALVTSRHGAIEARDLALTALPDADAPGRAEPDAACADRRSEPVAAPPAGGLDGLLDRLLAAGQADVLRTVESALVQRAFQRSRGNQVQTARLLGVTRNAMRTLLRRHDLIDSHGA